MGRNLQLICNLVIIVFALAQNPELPLCPTGIQFFPQTLPMHCRMPNNGNGGDNKNSNDANTPVKPTFPPAFFQSPPPGKLPPPYPYPVPPGYPAPLMMPGPMPMPGPVPLLPPPPSQKLPIIVMPFYSPDKSFMKTTAKPKRKDRRKKDKNRDGSKGCSSSDTNSDTNTDTDTDTDTDKSSTDTDTSASSDTNISRSRTEFWKPKGRQRKRKHRRRRRKNNYRRSSHNKLNGRRSGHSKNFLTPLIQYVTKDGYVIFEKQISKHEAKDWLSSNKEEDDENDFITNDSNNIDDKKVADVDKNRAEDDKEESEDNKAVSSDKKEEPDSVKSYLESELPYMPNDPWRLTSEESPDQKRPRVMPLTMRRKMPSKNVTIPEKNNTKRRNFRPTNVKRQPPVARLKSTNVRRG